MALIYDPVTNNISIPKETDETLIISKKTGSFASPEVLYLKVKESPTATTAIITKEVDTFVGGAAYFEFDSADTEDIAVGTYFYDIIYKTTTGAKPRLIPYEDCEVPTFKVCQVVTTDV